MYIKSIFTDLTLVARKTKIKIKNISKKNRFFSH